MWPISAQETVEHMEDVLCFIKRFVPDHVNTFEDVLVQFSKSSTVVALKIRAHMSHAM